MKARISLAGTAVALVLAFGASTATADIIINTDGSTTAGGGANVTSSGGGSSTVNAQVVIHFDADGTMTVTLKNLLSTTTSGGQEITGITINTTPTLTVNSPLKNTFGQLVDDTGKFVETGATGLDNQDQFTGGTSDHVTNGGVGISNFDDGSGTGHNKVAASNWLLTSAAGSFSVIGGAKPTQSVISASGNNNVSQTPLFLGSVGVVAGTNENTLLNFQVTSVVFQFGTQSGQDTVTVHGPFPGPGPDVVPAPSSAILLGLGGLSLVGFVGLRRRRKAAVAA